MVKGCVYLAEEESMDGIEYTCEHPIFHEYTCEQCELGPKRKEGEVKGWKALKKKYYNMANNDSRIKHTKFAVNMLTEMVDLERNFDESEWWTNLEAQAYRWMDRENKQWIILWGLNLYDDIITYKPRKEDNDGCNTSTDTIGIEEPETSLQ